MSTHGRPTTTSSHRAARPGSALHTRSQVATKKKGSATKRPKKNTGTSFEQLTREVFAKMEDLTKMGATVTHNVVLKGKAGIDHQIDVYVEFKAGDIPYGTVVSCKDHRGPVKKSHVMELNELLKDLSGQPRGIIVSRGGFQKGAIEYARHHGIELYQLREKQDEDWDGLIQQVGITVNIRVPHYEMTAAELDTQWAKTKLQEMGITGGSWNFTSEGGWRKDCPMLSGRDTTWDEIFKPHMPAEPNTLKKVHIEFDGGDRPVREVAGFPLPSIPYKSVTARIGFSVIEQQIEINFDHAAAYCFRDAIKQRHRFLASDGGPPRHV